MKTTLLSAAALLLAACNQSMYVTVTNPTDVERIAETVEIGWNRIATLRGVTPENVVVLDDAGRQVPSQVVYLGQSEPQSLIFQLDAGARAAEHFTVRVGEREEYPAKAYGRQVPERYDDYAWENDKVAYRLYGPALETSPEKLITPGIDVWVKCTDKLVIDERYARGHYHHNYGDGMDCYKVGVTLGGGSAVPFVDGALRMMPHNYATCRTLDNGPIRTTVELTYAPFDIDGRQTRLTKIISLDARRHFNRMEVLCDGDFAELPIAAGFVRHDVKQTLSGDGWFAMCEAASDTKNPERDGDIYAAVLLPEARLLPDTLGHALAVGLARRGEPMIYYAGAGWSRGGVEHMEQWLEELEQTRAAVETPLQVTVR